MRRAAPTSPRLVWAVAAALGAAAWAAPSTRAFAGAGFCTLLAATLGLHALRAARRKWGRPSDSSLALATALGLGLLVWLAPILGALGAAAPDRGAFRLGLAALTACATAAELLRRDGLGAALAARIDRFRARRLGAGGWTAAALAALFLARAGIAANTPSVNYDVLEYHLPAVRQMTQTGSTAPIPGNAYTLMPQGAETLHAFAAALGGGDAESGAKAMTLLLALAALATLNALLREFRLRGALRAAALGVFALHPTVFALRLDAFPGMTTALFAAAAALAWMRAMRLPNRLDLALAGAFAGFAVATKLPALGLVAAPLVLLLAPAAGGAAGGRKEALRAVLLTGVFAAAAFLPWLLRGFAADGSPFPPMTAPWFGDFPSQAEARLRAFMITAHAPDWSDPTAYLARLGARAYELGWALVAGGIGLALAARRDRRALGLCVWAAVAYALWAAPEHAPGRYLAPTLPLLAVGVALLAKTAERRLPGLRGWATAPFWVWILWTFCVQTLQLHGDAWLDAGTGRLTREAFLRRNLGLTADFFRAIDRATNATPRPKTLLVYETRTGALAAPAVANTVFDPSPLWTLLADEPDASTGEVLAVLRRRGFTHVAVNEIELARLLATYPAPPAREDPRWRRAKNLADESPGGFHPTMLAMRPFYPPYWFADASRDGTPERFRRFDALLAALRARAVWRRAAGPAEMWVAPLAEPDEAH